MTTVKPISPEARAEAKLLESLGAWDIAKHFNCGYSGDRNPIDHGGFFYDVRDWKRYGYARVVEFWTDSEAGEDTLHVSQGVINRPDNLEAMFHDSGMELTGEEMDSSECQIECARDSEGIEPDAYSVANTYRLDRWAEWRIWRSVAPMLRQLGS